MTWWMSWLARAALGLVTLAPASLEGHPAAEAPADGAVRETWAGHQVVRGSRKVPMLGTLKTRIDTYLVAEVVRDGGQVRIEQRACGLRFAKVAGVSVWLNADALPVTKIKLEPGEDGTLSGSSRVSWDDEDLDRDGNPGMTVRVEAPLCSGRLFVANDTKTRMRSTTLRDGKLSGKVSVDIGQEILGAETRCLSAMAKNSEEKNRGRFTYVKVEDGATCNSLWKNGWPVVVD